MDALDPLLTLLVFLGVFFAPMIPLALLLTMKGLLARVAAPPEEVRSYLTRSLRRRGLAVGGDRNRIDVRLDRWSMLLLHIEPSEGGTRVRAQTYGTPLGLAFVLAFILVFWFSWLALALALRMRKAAAEAARSLVVPTLASVSGHLPPLPAPDVRSLLVEGLSETTRQAGEAYEAERMAYWERLTVAEMVGFLAWLGIFLAVFLSVETEFSYRLSVAFWTATAVVVPVGLTLFAVLRSRFRRETRDLQASFLRLSEALSREISGLAVPDEEETTIGLLVDSLSRLASWQDVRWREQKKQDPRAFVPWLVGFIAAWLLLQAGLLLPLGFVALAFAVLGVDVAIAYLWLDRRWRDQAARELRRERAASESFAAAYHEELANALGRR